MVIAAAEEATHADALIGECRYDEAEHWISEAVRTARDTRSDNELVRDVERYLADESVEACPPSAGYRFRKFVRRHRGPVWAASIIFLLLVGGIAGTTWGLIQATKAEALAVKEAKQKEAALTAAR